VSIPRILPLKNSGFSSESSLFIEEECPGGEKGGKRKRFFLTDPRTLVDAGLIKFHLP